MSADDFPRREERTLGEAANRWVTLQIVMSAVGIIIFLVMLFMFFLPMWNSMPRP